MTDLAWATEPLTAWHTDPIMDEGRHQHTWVVTVFWPLEPFRDARALRASLRTILDAWQGGDLPPEVWSSEAVAKAVLHLHGSGGVCGVTVDRPEFGGCGVGVYK